MNTVKDRNAPKLNAAKRVEYSVENGTRRETTVIKRNRTWKTRSLPGYSLASRCTTDRLHVSLRTVTFCDGVLRSARFITAHYVSHFRRDCRGRFLNCQKIVTVSTVIPACYVCLSRSPALPHGYPVLLTVV